MQPRCSSMRTPSFEGSAHAQARAYLSTAFREIRSEPGDRPSEGRFAGYSPAISGHTGSRRECHLCGCSRGRLARKGSCPYRTRTAATRLAPFARGRNRSPSCQPVDKHHGGGTRPSLGSIARPVAGRRRLSPARTCRGQRRDLSARQGVADRRSGHIRLAIRRTTNLSGPRGRVHLRRQAHHSGGRSLTAGHPVRA